MDKIISLLKAEGLSLTPKVIETMKHLGNADNMIKAFNSTDLTTLLLVKISMNETFLNKEVNIPEEYNTWYYQLIAKIMVLKVSGMKI
jgi:hypothetical protein